MFRVGGLSRFLALRTLKCSGIKLPIESKYITDKVIITVLGGKGALTQYTLIAFSRLFSIKYYSAVVHLFICSSPEH